MAPDTKSKESMAILNDGKRLKEITWEELAQHNTSVSCWIGIRDKVYDVTKFLYRHPGGYDTLLYGAGRDCTVVFETYHQPDQLVKVLEKYLIGSLASDELPTFPEPNQFQTQLKQRVYSQLKKNSQDEKMPTDISVWLRYLGIYFGVYLFWYAMLYLDFVKNNLILQSLSGLALGFFCAQVGLHPLHDGSHFAVTHNPLVWKVLGASHDFINGSSYLAWVYQHMLGHHPYTNVVGADPDISVSDPDIRRIHPFQTWYAKYIGQENYVPLLYGLLAWKTRVQDIFIIYIEKTNDNIRVNPPTLWHSAVFWLGKLFFCWYRIYLPIMVVGWQKMLLLLVLSDLVSSYWLALTFQVNHVTDTVEYLAYPTEEHQRLKVEMDWAELQLKTTQDYAHHSSLWTWITGGLNYQAVHHVFPNIHQAYYPELAKGIEETCNEYDIPFIVQDNFTDAFMTHFNLLKKLGQS